MRVLAGGRRLVVGLDRRDSGLVAVDGHPVRADLVEAGRAWSLLVQTEESVARSYEVDFEASTSDGQTVIVDGCEIRVVFGAASAERPSPARPRATGGAADGSVRAPMPGRIIEVLVKQGDAVTTGQGLVVIEAMKMENELRAPHDAIVADVSVTVGSHVEAGAVLVVLSSSRPVRTAGGVA